MTSKKKVTTAKAKGLQWVESGKDQWVASGDEWGGDAPPRIKRLDTKTFACYRDLRYLGSEPTLELAKDRCAENKVSERNRVMRLWEEAHPDELPPGLQLTEGERAEYWRRHPPKAAMRPALGAMAKTGGPRKAVDAGLATPGTLKALGATLVKEPRPKRGEGGNRDAEIAALLKRGCTSEEVLRVTGWKAISMPAMAKKLGVGLRIDKGRKPFMYYAEEKKGGK